MSGFGAVGRIGIVAFCVGLMTAAGCSSGEDPAAGQYPNKTQHNSSPYQLGRAQDEEGGLFGPKGLFFGSNKNKPGGEDSGGGIGVNSFLWRASLDTVSFMPVNSADPFGGVIITDWYAMPSEPNERFKMNVYILGRSLRADGVRVAVFRQTKTADGGWVDAAVEPGTGTKIEDAILTRARQLRFDTLSQQQ
jgi:hypothetical protein